MSVNNENIKNIISDLIQQERFDKIPLVIEELFEEDLEEIFDSLTEEEKISFLKHISHERAARLMENLSSEEFETYIDILNPEEKVWVVDEMDDDDIVDILYDLSEEKQQEIIHLLDDESAKEVLELLTYEEDTAGGMMTKDYITISENNNVKTAIKTIRNDAIDAETIYYIYVVDDFGKLKGVVSLKDLITASDDTLIAVLMQSKVISVNVNDDEEDVANAIKKYGFLALPVVDDNNILLGIVTVDDAIDVLEDVATKDIYQLAGSTRDPDETDNRFFYNIWVSIKSRLPWLIVTLLGGLVSSAIIRNFDALLEREVLLASFLPLLTGMGGNVGTQSSTLTVRAIAIGKLGKNKIRRIFGEMTTGISMGICCGLIAGAITLIFGASISLAILVAFAMCANMFTAAAIGTTIPMIFQKLNIDPAVASAPFITTIVDATGLTIYFTLIALFLKFI